MARRRAMAAGKKVEMKGIVVVVSCGVIEGEAAG